MDAARQIENLIYAYAARIDAGDLAGVGALFADARIVSGEGDAKFTFSGSSEIEALYANTVQIHSCGTPRTKHITTNVAIEIDPNGETAVAHSYYSVLQQTPTLPLQTIVAGRYADTFAAVDEKWRFDTREIFVDLVGDVSQHLLINLDPT